MWQFKFFLCFFLPDHPGVELLLAATSWDTEHRYTCCFLLSLSAVVPGAWSCWICSLSSLCVVLTEMLNILNLNSEQFSLKMEAEDLCCFFFFYAEHELLMRTESCFLWVELKKTELVSLRLFHVSHVICSCLSQLGVPPAAQWWVGLTGKVTCRPTFLCQCSLGPAEEDS